MLSFIAGLFIGTAAGVITTALLVMAKGDERIDS
jgi:hypothetical protein